MAALDALRPNVHDQTARPDNRGTKLFRIAQGFVRGAALPSVCCARAEIRSSRRGPDASPSDMKSIQRHMRHIRRRPRAEPSAVSAAVLIKASRHLHRSTVTVRKTSNRHVSGGVQPCIGWLVR